MHEEIYPTIIDIEMAIDRFRATRFIQENVVMQNSIPSGNMIIPLPDTSPYIIGRFIIINAQLLQN